MNETSRPIAVSVANLAHAYEGRAALTGISFSVAEGELFGILGPNGGGKSTTFRILATLLTPDSGSASIWGFDVRRQRQEVRRRIGVAFQAPALDVKLTVKENLVHHGHLYGLSGADLRGRIDRALETIALTDRAGDRVEVLSGGLRRRIELAKALMPEPSVLLLDEPTVGLDPRARDEFWELVGALRADTGMTVLVTTHLLTEGNACDRIAILDAGRLVALDTPAALCAEIDGEIVTLHGRGIADHQDQIRGEFAVPVDRAGESLRIVVGDSASFVARVRQRFGDQIESVSIAKPSLSDVFRKRTGHAFDNGSLPARSRE